MMCCHPQPHLHNSHHSRRRCKTPSGDAAVTHHSTDSSNHPLDHILHILNLSLSMIPNLPAAARSCMGSEIPSSLCFDEDVDRLLSKHASAS